MTLKFQPKFIITNKIASGLTIIERARGFLEAAELSKEWITSMGDRALVLEAHHTTHIEGTQLTLDQSRRLLAGEDVSNVDPDDVRELLNYRRAFDLVSKYLDSSERITRELLLEIHKKLVEGVRGSSATPGEYRNVQNYVVNSATRKIIYKPPPPEDVPGMMEILIEWLNSETETHPVLVSGIAQFQLVHIHPFRDGNGRTSRLLSTLCLYRAGYDFKKLFTISEYYDRNRDVFYKAIQDVRENDMDMTGWLEYFIEGLSTQMQEMVERGKEAIRCDLIVKQYDLKERQAKALGFLIEHGGMTIQNYEQICPETNRRTLQRDIKIMIEKGLLVSEGATNQLIYRLREDIL
ncbi:MAG: Fic family protein [Candidatus Methanoperedenaceae archaeon]|nr:Fic family protein [Candidatus Methanoperedenaceae archaeon]